MTDPTSPEAIHDNVLQATETIADLLLTNKTLQSYDPEIIAMATCLFAGKLLRLAVDVRGDGYDGSPDIAISAMALALVTSAERDADRIITIMAGLRRLNNNQTVN